MLNQNMAMNIYTFEFLKKIGKVLFVIVIHVHLHTETESRDN